MNLTVPLQTLLGESDTPGHVAGFGPLDAQTVRDLAAAAAADPATRWCVTVTDQAGRPVGHGCARRVRRGAPARGDPATADAPAMGDSTELVIKVGWLASGDCAHEREAAGYQPPRRLRHLIEIRDQTCSFPGCRRPATRCDLDHTIPYARGGENV